LLENQKELASKVAGINIGRRSCGCSSMVERQPSKLHTRVRFPSPAFLEKKPLAVTHYALLANG
jgi:hypothetical protein